MTPSSALAVLGTMQPTSRFGELFQYSNLMAGAGGFVAGHVAFPEMELGPAYDLAMSRFVFEPLGMRVTTFDYPRALAGNRAWCHGSDVDGKTVRAQMEPNYSIIPLRPAGGAWSSINDMLRYVSMELGEGRLPSGSRYIEKGPLLERRATMVSIGKDVGYGMGLEVDRTYAVDVVHHGGDMLGFHSDMIWLPDFGTGAVIFTNSDPGWLLRTHFRRKLLEVLFEGRAEAGDALIAAGKAYFEQLAAERKLLNLPADLTASSRLASRYRSSSLGEITVRREAGRTFFDFGEWKS